MSRAHKHSAPTHTEYVTVSLDDFSIEEIREYLENEGEGDGPDPLGQGGRLVISEDDMDRISTLAVCGQNDPAVSFLLEIVSKHIGRPLRMPTPKVAEAA